MPQFRYGSNAVVAGSQGGIGSALVSRLIGDDHFANVFCLSRQTVMPDTGKVMSLECDITDTSAVDSCRDRIAAQVDHIDLLFIATGILHNDRVYPEKRIEDLTMSQMQEVFSVNAFAPMLLAKSFTPIMNDHDDSVIAALSARVGSIGDNRLGGWYSYRASKSALNMYLRTFSIEMKRKNPNLIVTLLHPGTINTKLSRPFRKNVPAGKLFAAEKSVDHMLQVITRLTPEDSGNFYAWDGKAIEW